MTKLPGERPRDLARRLSARGIDMSVAPHDFGDMAVLENPAKARTLLTMAQSLLSGGDQQRSVSTVKKLLLLLGEEGQQVQDAQIEVDLIQRGVILAARAMYQQGRDEEAINWLFAATYADCRHSAVAAFTKSKAMTMTNSHKRLELLHISILNGNFQLKQQLFSLLDALRSNVAVTSRGRLGTGAEAGTLVTRAPRGGGGAGPSAAVLQEQADTEAPEPRQQIVDIDYSDSD